MRYEIGEQTSKGPFSLLYKENNIIGKNNSKKIHGIKIKTVC
jgi:hypothetical protein